MIHQFNDISRWVQCVVLQQRNKKRRTKIIEKFIHIAVHLKKLRNFSACCAVYYGLNANALFRQKAAWSGVNNHDMKDYKNIKNLFSSDDNQKKLRLQHKKAHAPSILHTGLFLQDLLTTDEALDDKKKDGNVNFTKLHRMYVLIEKICMYQQSQYKIDDDKLYKISTTVRDRDNEGKEIDDAEFKKFKW